MVSEKKLELPEAAWKQLANALRGTIHLLSATLDLDELLELTLEKLAEVVPSDTSSILLLEGNMLSVFAARGFGERTPEVLQASFDIREDISDDVIRVGQPLIVADVQQEGRWALIPGAECVRGWLGVPLLAKDRAIGMLCLDSVTPGRFSEEEAQIALAFANQVAVAIENSRLFEEAGKRARQLQTAAEVSRAASSILDPDELLRQAVDLIRERFGLYYTGIFLVDDAGQYAVLRAGTGEAGQEMLKRGHKLEVGGESMIGWCVANARARIALDVGQEAVRFENPLLPGTRSEMALPLISRGQVIGAVTVQSSRVAAFSAEDITVLQTMADQLANAIRNARLFQGICSTLERLDTMNRVSGLINSSLELQEVLETIASSAAELAGADSSGIFQWSAGGDFLELKIAYGVSAGFLAEVRETNPRPGQGAIGRAGVSRVPVEISDISTYPGYEYKDLLARHGYRSVLAVPVLAREKVLGGINLWWREEHHTAPQDLSVLVALANQAATAIENARAYEEERRARVLTETLRRAGQVVSSTLDLDEVFERILLELEWVVPYDSASVQLLKEGRVEIIGGRGFPNLPEIVGLSFSLDGDNPNREVIRRRDYFIAPDAPAVYGEFSREPHRQAGIRGWLGVPMLVGDRLIGMIALDSRQPGFYTEEHARLAQTFAAQAAIAIENARLFDQTRADANELEAVFSAITDIICVLDKDCVILKANPATAEQYLGTSLQELIGSRCRGASYGSGEFCKSCTVRFTLETRRPMHRVMQTQLPGGGSIWLDMATYPIFDEKGELSRVVGYGRDITNRKRLEAQLLQAQKMEAVGTLAGGIAHDFNNILTSILGYTSLVIGQLEPGDPQREDLQYVERAARRAADLTRQLLTFSRRAVGEPKPMYVAPLIKELTRLLERTFPRNITIRTVLPREIGPVLVEPSQLEQVVMNLCINARDAMPEGGELLIEVQPVFLDEEYCRAHADGSEPGSYVLISVSDTGHGMNEETLRRAFDPFFTTKEVGKGTGLGLAVVWGIAKNCGGFVHLYSEVGIGTSVHVYLPTSTERPPETALPEPTVPAGTETVLVVDDEEMVRGLGRRILERRGYKVLLARDGVEALQVYKANEEEVALVVLDLIMPKMDGHKTLKKLKELNPAVKVLLASGYSANGEARKALGEGAVGFVQKPFSFVDLAAAVREALDRQ
jgi:PAS domain S-box-containing protein